MSMLLPNIDIEMIPIDARVVMAVLLLGAILKHCTGDWIANRMIPVVLMFLSAALEVAIKYTAIMADPSVENILIIIMTGLTSAILAIGMHSSGKNVFCNGAFVAYFTGSHDALYESQFDQLLKQLQNAEKVEILPDPVNESDHKNIYPDEEASDAAEEEDAEIKVTVEELEEAMDAFQAELDQQVETPVEEQLEAALAEEVHMSDFVENAETADFDQVVEEPVVIPAGREIRIDPDGPLAQMIKAAQETDGFRVPVDEEEILEEEISEEE